MSLNSKKNLKKKETDSETKISIIAANFKNILETLELDLTNPNLKNSPHRIAKMYVNELFTGLKNDNFPSISLFENNYDYQQMLVQKEIHFVSMCSHHFMPFIGYATIAYFPGTHIIGLSKLNRIVKHFAKKPQVQENLTQEIGTCLQDILKTDHVAVYLNAKHFCIIARGIEDSHSFTSTYFLEGKFREAETKQQFLNEIKNKI